MTILPLLMLAFSPAQARNAAPIFILFEFRAPAVAGLYPPADRRAAEEQLSQKLALRCLEKMPYWSFQPSTPTNYPQLRVFLEKRTDLTLCMQLVVAAAAVPNEPWKCTFFAPGEEDRLGGLPNERDLPREIEARFHERLLSANREIILTELKENCPVGRRVIPNPSPLLATLPLDYSKYPALSTANFRIVCRLTNAGRIVLFSEGLGEPWEFQDAAGPFRAIAIKHQQWEENQTRMDILQQTNRLGQLVVGAFYLLKVNPIDFEGLSVAASP